jgi:uncharacterized repeat protein (TIGR04076 family)
VGELAKKEKGDGWRLAPEEVMVNLVIRVVEIKGSCPVYEIGNTIVLKGGYVLDPKETGPVCMHSLASILPYYVALSRGIRAKDLGLSRDDSEEAYVQCLDPCEITGGGTVRFEISRIDESEYGHMANRY